MKFISTRKPSSGIPLGGLGTGSVEIRPDGCLYEWLIFNNKPWSGYGSPEFPVDRKDFVFAVRVKSESEEPVVRLLRTDLWEECVDITYSVFSTVINPYQMPWVRSVEEIKFEGRPPFAFLEYLDSAFNELGLEASLEAFSPMIPGDVGNSSIPVAIFKFNFKNMGDKKLQISLMALMKNPHGASDDVKVSNEVVESDGFTALLMKGEGLSEKHGMHRGALAIAFLGRATATADLAVKRGDKRTKAYRLRRLLVDFRGDGVLSGGSSAVAVGEELYGALAKNVEVGPGKEAEIVFVLAWFYPNHLDSTDKRIGHYYENFFSSPIDVVEYVVRNFDNLYARTREFIETMYKACYDEWISDLAVSQVTTLAKSTWLSKDGLFGVWEGGPGCCGLNTVDVALWAITGVALLYPELAKSMTKLMSKFILRPELTPYYEVFALAFPENMALYRELLKRDPSIQHNVEKFRKVLREIVKQTGKDPTGRVPHLLAASFDVVDNYDRSDLMPEYVLIALLNYYWTGDLEYLKQLWSSIKDVIEAMLRQHDNAGLKLPYHSPPSGYEGFSQAARELAVDERHRRLLEFLLSGPMYIPTTVNTFDALSLMGIATFTSDLWVASLKAAVVAAEKLGDNYADELKEICREAIMNFVECLWNGEYFDLWYDPLTSYRDEACMSAALTGEWYLGVLLGLGYAVDREKVVSMLRAVYKYNFKKWEGLLNATYPGKPRPALKGDMRYFNEVEIPYAVGGQMDTPWTGIEIPVAVHMIWEGMIEEGLRILRAVHERYASWGLYWNHIECDGHYFRVLCSLLIPNALAGARYIGTAKKLEISPRVSRSSFKGPVLAPGAVLSCEQEENEGELMVRLRVRLGRLAVNELELFASKPVFKISVKLNEKERRCSYNQDGSKLKVLLDSLELEEGDELLLKAVYE